VKLHQNWVGILSRRCPNGILPEARAQREFKSFEQRANQHKNVTG
jgi:hypothetical protein